MAPDNREIFNHMLQLLNSAIIHLQHGKILKVLSDEF